MSGVRDLWAMVFFLSFFGLAFVSFILIFLFGILDFRQDISYTCYRYRYSYSGESFSDLTFFQFWTFCFLVYHLPG